MKLTPRTLCLLLPLLAAGAAHGAAPEPVTLDNGLRVLALPGSAGDVCGVHLAIAIGPEREPAHKAGLRALTQQVLLNRVRDQVSSREDLEPLRREGSQGAGFSVDTEPDSVEFAASVTTAHLPLLLSIMAPAVFEATWTDADVVNARELMISRDDLRLDNVGPVQEAYDLFRRALVGDSPLHRPTYGTELTREAITLTDVRAFYQSYYVPNLTTMTVVSPLPAEQVVALVRDRFGGYQPRRPAPAPAVGLEATESRVEIGSSADLDRAVVVVGVPLPPVGTDGYVMGHIVHAALSGPRGMLFREPEVTPGLPPPARLAGPGADGLGVLLPAGERAPCLALFARARPTAVEEARQVLLGLLLRFMEEPLSAEDLHRARLRAINLHAARLSEPAAAAAAANRALVLGGDAETTEEFTRRIMDFTAEDIQQLAREQFARHAIGVMMPGR